jgi:hypothetical protein
MSYAIILGVNEEGPPVRAGLLDDVSACFAVFGAIYGTRRLTIDSLGFIAMDRSQRLHTSVAMLMGMWAVRHPHRRQVGDFMWDR